MKSARTRFETTCSLDASASSRTRASASSIFLCASFCAPVMRATAGSEAICAMTCSSMVSGAFEDENEGEDEEEEYADVDEVVGVEEADNGVKVDGDAEWVGGVAGGPFHR